MAKECDEFFPNEVVCMRDDATIGMNVEGVVLSQKQGLLQLRGYFLGRQDFEDLKPFLIEHVPISTRLGRNVGGARVFVGNVNGRYVYWNLSEDLGNVIRGHHTMFAFPKQDGLKRYRWIDLYRGDESGQPDFSKVLCSCRIEESGSKISAKGFYGFERQLFIDYSTSSDSVIDSDELREFIVPCTSPKSLYIGVNKGTYVQIKGDFSKAVSKQVLIKPGYERQSGYAWVDLYVIEDGAEQFLFSRRIELGSRSFSEWKGLGVQVMVDWIVKGEKVANLKAVTCPVIGGDAIYLTAAAGMRVAVDLRRGLLRSFDAVVLEPRCDELYEWVEVYGVRNGQVSAEVIRYLKVERNLRRKLRRWVGPEKQRYIDYLQKKLPFDQPRPFSMHVRFGRNRWLAYKRTQLDFYFYKPDGVKEGEVLSMSPELGSDGRLIFCAKGKDSRILKRFILHDDFTVRKLNGDGSSGAVEIGIEGKAFPDKRPNGYWTLEMMEQELREFYLQEGSLVGLKKKRPDLDTVIKRRYPGGREAIEEKLGIVIPRVEFKTGEFFDVGGRRFVPVHILAEQFGIPYATARRRLNQAGVSKIRGRAWTGNCLYLYEFDGGIRALGELTNRRVRRSLTLDLVERKERDLADLSAEEKSEINRKFWLHLEDNPDSKESVVDFARSHCGLTTS